MIPILFAPAGANSARRLNAYGAAVGRELDFSAFLNYNPDIDRVICALSAGAKAPRETDGNSALSQ